MLSCCMLPCLPSRHEPCYRNWSLHSSTSAIQNSEHHGKPVNRPYFRRTRKWRPRHPWIDCLGNGDHWENKVLGIAAANFRKGVEAWKSWTYLRLTNHHVEVPMRHENPFFAFPPPTYSTFSSSFTTFFCFFHTTSYISLANSCVLLMFLSFLHSFIWTASTNTLSYSVPRAGTTLVTMIMRLFLPVLPLLLPFPKLFVLLPSSLNSTLTSK